MSKASQHPSMWRKLRQLYGVVRASHRNPLQGKPNPPKLVYPDQLGVTFIGHSSFLIQIAGRNLLVDPVFATRLILLRRARRPGILVRDLPPIDAVLLTHAHMDHLNLPSLRQVIRHAKQLTGVAPEVIVPTGVRDLVESLGFRRITELEWWQSAVLEASTSQPGDASPDPVADPDVTVTLTPAKHWGARMFKDTHRLFGGYVIQGAGHSVYHSGDTAYFNGFREIGQRLHPTLALLPIGAYFPDSYRAVHTSPEEGLQAFLDLRTATKMIPMHFGTFPLGREPMAEPPVRLRTAARQAGVLHQVEILSEGETYIHPPQTQPVWQDSSASRSA